MNPNDRLARGFIAGVSGGAVMLVPDLFLYQVGINKVRYLDWASVVMYGRQPQAILEMVWAEAGHLFFTGLLGVVFVFLISRLWSSSNYLFKGWFFGVSIWFGLYAYAIAFKLPGLAIIPLWSTVSNFVGASAYGIVLAAVSRWLYMKTGLPEN